MVNVLEGAGCPICGETTAIKRGEGPLNQTYLINCPICGKVVLPDRSIEIRPDHVSAYLFYTSLSFPDPENHVFIYSRDGQPYGVHANTPKVHWFSEETVQNWYPKTFSEKIDNILLALAHYTKYWGDGVRLSDEQWTKLFFIESPNPDKPFFRINEDEDADLQHRYILKYLGERGYIVENDERFIGMTGYPCTLAPDGLKRVEELQRTNAFGKNCFVAMSFKDEMKPIREAICRAIEYTGYVPRIMDEIEHNRQIVPEMLYEIRNARFIIAELTGHNNGAYYEAGYALGLGKEVIHICQKGALSESLHFDVKQVNTVIWEDISELAEKLTKRIFATVI